MCHGILLIFLLKGGALGRGTYFAVDSSYSANGYAYAGKNGSMLLLFVKILAGKSYNGGGNFDAPPLINKNSNVRYDSVKNGNVYVIYSNNRSYPMYLLEFKMGGGGGIYWFN